MLNLDVVGLTSDVATTMTDASDIKKTLLVLEDRVSENRAVSDKQDVVLKNLRLAVDEVAVVKESINRLNHRFLNLNY